MSTTDLTDLPAVLATYVAAKNAHDVDRQLTCFSPAAEVEDEGETLVGTEQVRGWIQRTTDAYDLTVAPTAWDPDAGVMTAMVSGDFPGSPLEFRYHATFADGLLASLRPEA